MLFDFFADSMQQVEYAIRLVLRITTIIVLLLPVRRITYYVSLRMYYHQRTIRITVLPVRTICTMYYVKYLVHSLDFSPSVLIISASPTQHVQL